MNRAILSLYVNPACCIELDLFRRVEDRQFALVKRLACVVSPLAADNETRTVFGIGAKEKRFLSGTVEISHTAYPLIGRFVAITDRTEPVNVRGQSAGAP